MAQRVRDGLAAASWLRAQAGVDPDRIALAGRGLGGIVAIMVAAVLPGVRGTLCLDTPESIEAVRPCPPRVRAARHLHARRAPAHRRVRARASRG